MPSWCICHLSYDDDLISFIRICEISHCTNIKPGCINMYILNSSWKQETFPFLHIVQFWALYFQNTAEHFVSLVITHQPWYVVGFQSPRCPKAFICDSLKSIWNKSFISSTYVSIFPDRILMFLSISTHKQKKLLSLFDTKLSQLPLQNWETDHHQFTKYSTLSCIKADNYTRDLGRTFCPEENLRCTDSWRLVSAMTQVQLPVTKIM